MPNIYSTVDVIGYLSQIGSFSWSDFYGVAAASMVETSGNDSRIETIDDSTTAPSFPTAAQKRYYIEFNISNITLTPVSGTFNLHGSGYVSDAIPFICAQASFATAGEVVVGDWDAWNESSPVYYTNRLETWDDDGYNIFTLTQTALDFMGNSDNDEFQMVCMDADYQAIQDAPVDDGGESDPYSVAKLFSRSNVLGEEPFLSYIPFPPNLSIKSGKVTINSGKLIIK